MDALLTVLAVALVTGALALLTIRSNRKMQDGNWHQSGEVMIRFIDGKWEYRQRCIDEETQAARESNVW